MLGDYLICTETCGNDAGTALILNITHLGKERSRLEYGLPDTTRTSTSTVSPATILLTGFPGCGKTTLIKRVAQRLDDLRLAGFYTQELLGADGRRVGFEAIGLNGRSTTLAHVSSKSKDRVGRYGVELAGFEQLINEELAADPDVELVVVDEIGKMECFNRLFVDLVREVLGKRSPVLASVAMKGGGLIQEVKRRRDAELVSVSARNRDDLVEDLTERIHAKPVGRSNPTDVVCLVTHLEYRLVVDLLRCAPVCLNGSQKTYRSAGEYCGRAELRDLADVRVRGKAACAVLLVTSFSAIFLD
jgi:nucleoside-triphosphatase